MNTRVALLAEGSELQNQIIEVKSIDINETMWFIRGIHGLYTGGHFNRQDAIKCHCDALGKSWHYCKEKGDTVIKCEVKSL